MKYLNYDKMQISTPLLAQAFVKLLLFERNRQTRFQFTRMTSLKQLNLNAGGLDIGAAEIYAAVPEGRDEESVRQFETFTADLNSLADCWKPVGGYGGDGINQRVLDTNL